VRNGKTAPCRHRAGKHCARRDQQAARARGRRRSAMFFSGAWAAHYGGPGRQKPYCIGSGFLFFF